MYNRQRISQCLHALFGIAHKIFVLCLGNLDLQGIQLDLPLRICRFRFRQRVIGCFQTLIGRPELLFRRAGRQCIFCRLQSLTECLRGFLCIDGEIRTANLIDVVGEDLTLRFLRRFLLCLPVELRQLCYSIFNLCFHVIHIGLKGFPVV